MSHNDHCSVMQYFEIALFVKFSALRLAAIRDKWWRIIAAQIEEKPEPK